MPWQCPAAKSENPELTTEAAVAAVAALKSKHGPAAILMPYHSIAEKSILTPFDTARSPVRK